MKSTFQNIWFWITVVILGLFLYKSCNKGSVGFFGCNSSDTISHKIDTVIKENKNTFSYIPVPVFQKLIIEKPVWLKEPYENSERQIDSSEPDCIPVVVNSDTCSKTKDDYITERLYDDTLVFGNSKVRIKESVWKNRIKDRIVSLNTYDTTIKESTTIVKRKFIVYIGASIFGSKPDIFQGGIATVGFKGRNDMQYDFGIGKIRQQKEPIFSFGVKLPIRIFKK